MGHPKKSGSCVMALVTSLHEIHECGVDRVRVSVRIFQLQDRQIDLDQIRFGYHGISGCLKVVLFTSCSEDCTC
jgi:hypothetical protein